MNVTWTIVRRELAAYFATPLAYVFLVAFIVAAGAMTFYVGGFFGRRQADLSPFFMFHPWLFMALIPAIGMRLWAEERRTGTMELLMTLPITTCQAVAGKFIAGWLFAGLALALTFPMWLSVNWLGSPDNGVILASYVGSFLLAGAMLAVASCVSALTRNQVIAFILAIGVCLLLMVSGVEAITSSLRGVLPAQAVDLLASSSMLTRFITITKGVLDFRDVFYFASLIALFLYINTCIVEFERTA
jgi:ABC-2 type transport system permease protein